MLSMIGIVDAESTIGQTVEVRFDLVIPLMLAFHKFVLVYCKCHLFAEALDLNLNLSF